MKEPDSKWVEDKFEHQDFQPPIYITLARIYDLLAIIATHFEPIVAEDVLNAHERGYLIGHPPYLVIGDDDGSRTDSK